MNNFIKEEKNQIEFFLSRRYIRLCFIISIFIVGCIGIFNCFFVEITNNRQNTFIEYLVLFVTLFIGILPMVVSFINDKKNGFYISFILNIAFLIWSPIKEGAFWYIIILIAIPAMAIVRWSLNIAHHKIKIKPEAEIDDPYEKYPYNELETSDSDHDSGDDDGGDDDISGEGDIEG